MVTSTVRATCPHDCPDSCALLVTVQDGVATQVRGDPDHPTTAGVLCTKVSRYTERTIGDDLLRDTSPEFGPKIEALIVYNANPVAVAPGSPKVAQGFAHEDLFTVVLEHFQTGTAESDDVIAAQAFNRQDARAIHFDWDSLKRKGWQKLNASDAPFAYGGFPTQSGKCEFYCERMKQDGLDPLPAYTPPCESPASNPELAKKYPLAMISPPARNFLNSTFVNVQSLRDTEGEPHLDSILSMRRRAVLKTAIGCASITRVDRSLRKRA